MTPFLLLALAMGTFATAWLVRPLWFRAAFGTASVPIHLSSPRRWTALSLLALVVAGASCAWLSAPDTQDADAAPQPDTLLATARKPARAARDLGLDLAARASNAADVASAEGRVAAMADSLAERMKTRPDDADGWQTLGRSYAALGRHAQAAMAFRFAARLRPDDATLLAEYAFSVAVTDSRGASDEAAQLVARALRIDPRNPKALALAGTLAVDRKDYQGAIAHWEQWGQVEPADTPVGRQVRTSILQARYLAGLPGTSTPMAALAVVPTAATTRVASSAR